MKRFALHLVIVVFLLGVLWQGKAISEEYIVNGGFEEGSFTGWFKAYDDHWFINDDPTSVISGEYDAVFNAGYRRLSYIFQTFGPLPEETGSANISWSDRIVSSVGFVAGQQQVYAYIEDTDTGESYDLFKTVPGDEPSDYFEPNDRSFDLTEFVEGRAGHYLQIRFSLLGYYGELEFALDNVSFDISTGPANEPPVADAGVYVVQATSWDGALVTLDGSASSDPNGDELIYNWDIGAKILATATLGDPITICQFPIGTTEVSLTVTDSHGESDTDTTTVTVTIAAAEIDIKPGSDQNKINLKSKGVVPVAFLTDELLDAADINPETITLVGIGFSGVVKLRGKRQEPMAKLEDVDGDGDLDLVVHLLIESLELTQNLKLNSGAVTCRVGALAYDGWVVQGEDSINVVSKGK